MVFGLGRLFGGKKREECEARPDRTPAPAQDPAPGQTGDSQEESRSAYVRREPVFNRERRIAGHLLRLQLADAGLGNLPTERQQVYDDLLLKSLCLLKDEAGWGQLISFVPLASISLASPWLERLPADNTVILLTLSPDTPDGDALGDRIEQLFQRGLRFGVVRNPRHPAFAALLDQVDFAAANVAESQGANVRDFSVALRSAHDIRHLIELVGLNIETSDDQALCQRCHYTYFHGPFAASRGVDWEPAKGDPHKLHLMHLLNLANGNAEIPELAVALKQDPILTYRILRYLNSPAIGLSREITSIDQALVILGRQRLARWLSVLLFSVKDPDFADWLMVESSLTRGRVMEILGAQRFPAAEADHLFITGVFSKLDKLLHIALPEAVEQLRLPINVRSALLDQAGPYAPLLAVAEACEAFDPVRISKTAEEAGLDPHAVNQALMSATTWSSEVTTHWD